MEGEAALLYWQFAFDLMSLSDLEGILDMLSSSSSSVFFSEKVHNRRDILSALRKLVVMANKEDLK